MRLKLLIVAASLLAGGCSTLTDLGVVRKEALRNDAGDLVGYKQLMRNERTGEVFAQVQMFTPVRDGRGNILGYEEQVRDGAIIRDASGRTIGNRFADLRSRKGLTIVFSPADAPQVAASEPKLLELMASFSKSDLRRIQ